MTSRNGGDGPLDPPQPLLQPPPRAAKVQPDVALPFPLSTEVSAVRQPDEVLPEEPVQGGVAPEPEGARVDPGQVRRRLPPSTALTSRSGALVNAVLRYLRRAIEPEPISQGRASADGVVEKIAVAAQVLDESGTPRLAVVLPTHHQMPCSSCLATSSLSSRHVLLPSCRSF